jgi:tRNA modification GTPase
MGPFFMHAVNLIFESYSKHMLGKLVGWDDTIVALATPPGIGAIGVIRVSGLNAISIVDDLFPSKKLAEQLSHTIHVGFLKQGDIILDEVVVSLYKNPRSYTGEDVIEISTHGSPYVQQQVIDAIINKRARLAKPGEFTQRAFLNGKLDLTQAEAVADLISSNTEASKKNAIQNMRGGFSQVLKLLRDKLISFSALIELELDFSQEDVTFADRKQLEDLLNESTVVVKQLLDSFKYGNVIKNGVQVAIIGKPNAGKSTLLNTLLNEDRAIVSEIAGTTRDTIEEIININGILFRLIDTAGIRDHSSDLIENIGMQRSLDKMNEADVVIYLFDVNETSAEELKAVENTMNAADLKVIYCGNKADKKNYSDENFKDDNTIFISAKSGFNIEILKQQLFDLAMADLQTENTVITNSRHIAALKEVQQSLTEIIAGLEQNIPGDLLALDIRRCLHFLGEITGEITNEDQLDYIFSKFCIGK